MLDWKLPSFFLGVTISYYTASEKGKNLCLFTDEYQAVVSIWIRLYVRSIYSPDLWKKPHNGAEM